MAALIRAARLVRFNVVVTSAPSSFAVAVMAGGRSSRMGRDKALLPWQGERLIDHQLALLRSLGPSELLASVRNDFDYEPGGVTLVHDEVPDAGPLAGLVALLRATTAPHLLVLAVDMPLMTADTLRDIIALREPASGVSPRLGKDWEPLATLYPRDLVGRAQERLRSNHRSLQGLIEEAVASGEMRSLPIPPDRHPQFFNWNRPDDRPE